MAPVRGDSVEQAETLSVEFWRLFGFGYDVAKEPLGAVVDLTAGTAIPIRMKPGVRKFDPTG